jgi:hypothetical protein
VITIMQRAWRQHSSSAMCNAAKAIHHYCVDVRPMRHKPL